MARGLISLATVGLALAATLGTAQGQEIRSQTLAAGRLGGTAAMSTEQLVQIIKNAKPMEKRLQALPAGLSVTNAVLTANSGPAPAVMLSRSATIAPKNAPALPPPGSGNSAGTTPSQPVTSGPPATAIGSAAGKLAGAQSGLASITPQNYGVGNLGTVYHYTDLSLDPAATDASPAGRAVGYLLFSFDNTNYFYCTATLINNSILAAAGHCVHQGNNSNSGFIKVGYFFPTCWNCNTANPYFPYGYATVTNVSTTGSWFATGSLDQGFDVSALAITKRVGTTNEMGAYTGFFGFCYLNCLNNNRYLAARGFPGNYTGGNWMSESQHLAISDTRDYVFGTGMEGGSSGGPFAENMSTYGPNDTSTNLGQFTSRNIIFATRSWGYIDTSIKIGGASSLSGPGNANNYKAIYNAMCAAVRTNIGAGACTDLP